MKAAPVRGQGHELTYLQTLFGLSETGQGQEGWENKQGQPRVRSGLGCCLVFHKDALVSGW